MIHRYISSGERDLPEASTSAPFSFNYPLPFDGGDTAQRFSFCGYKQNALGLIRSCLMMSVVLECLARFHSHHLWHSTFQDLGTSIRVNISDLQNIYNHLPQHLLSSIYGDKTYAIVKRGAMLLPHYSNFISKKNAFFASLFFIGCP